MKKRKMIFLGEPTEQIFFMEEYFEIILMTFPLESSKLKLFNLIFGLIKTIITQKPSLILVYPLSYLCVPSALIARFFGLPHVSFAYGNDFVRKKSKLAGFIIFLSIRLSNGIICDYEGLAKLIRSKGGSNTVAIPMGAIMPSIQVYEQFRDPEMIISVLNFNLAYVKGIDLLISAIKKIPKARLTLIGEGSYLEPMKRFATKLGLSERVIFTGHVSQERLWSYLQTASIFALATRTSHIEGTNRATLEAMHFSLPVVVTRVGGMAELVTDEVNGFVVPPEDQAALKHALLRLLNDQGMRERIGKVNKEKAELYSVKNMSLARYQYLSSLIKS